MIHECVFICTMLFFSTILAKNPRGFLNLDSILDFWTRNFIPFQLIIAFGSRHSIQEFCIMGKGRKTVKKAESVEGLTPAQRKLEELRREGESFGVSVDNQRQREHE